MNKLIAAIALGLASPMAALAQNSHAGHGVTDPATTDGSTLNHAAMSHGDTGDMSHGMTGALGSYSMSREASGTSWQPDASPHAGDFWVLVKRREDALSMVQHDADEAQAKADVVQAQANRQAREEFGLT